MNTHPFFFSCRHWLTGLASVFIIATLGFSLSAFAAAAEGKEYKRLALPQTTEAPGGKIEVIEFFSYGCPHCAEFNPLVDAWKKKLPADVVFQKLPISWGRPQWQSLARAFYALEAMDMETKLSSDVFEALHKGRVNLTDSKIFFDWAEKKGVDRKKLEEMYNSFAVNSKVTQADKKAEGYKVQSVPRFYVNGRFEIDTEASGSIPQILSTIDEVIAIARQEAKKK